MVFTKSKAQFYLCLCLSTFLSVINSQVVFDVANCTEANLSNCTNRQYFTVANTDVAVIVKNVPSVSSFFVIQAHSFLNDIILSGNSVPQLHFYNEGTNVGLVQVTSGKNNFTFYLSNKNKSLSVDVLIAVTFYKEKDPIPGGCNLVFDVENAPYQLINYDNDMVEVSVQAPSVFGRTCEDNFFSLEIYRIYLHEGDLTSQTYFNGIQKMLTVDNIRKYGWRMYNKTNGHNNLRMLYSAYPGIGSVYAMIAVYKNGEAAYVPAVTYACDAKNRMEDCVQPVTLFWRVIAGLTIAWGLLICLLGFLFSMLFSYLFTGFIIGALIMYILYTSTNSPLLENYRFHVTATSMVMYIVVWMAVWYKCRSLRSIIELILNGMLIASFFFHVLIGDVSIFENNLNYWVVFWSIVMVVATLQGLCCVLQVRTTNSIMGAFITVLAIDHFAGSYVRYMVINVIRRLTVNNFNLAIISPPMQIRDVLIYFSCLGILALSVIFNLLVLPGASMGLSETTPLLG